MILTSTWLSQVGQWSITRIANLLPEVNSILIWTEMMTISACSRLRTSSGQMGLRGRDGTESRFTCTSVALLIICWVCRFRSWSRTRGPWWDSMGKSHTVKSTWQNSRQGTQFWSKEFVFVFFKSDPPQIIEAECGHQNLNSISLSSPRTKSPGNKHWFLSGASSLDSRLWSAFQRHLQAVLYCFECRG